MSLSQYEKFKCVIPIWWKIDVFKVKLRYLTTFMGELLTNVKI